MGKKKKMTKMMKNIIAENNVKDVAHLQGILKDMLKTGVEALLVAELEDELGYERYDRKRKKQTTGMVN